jgi:hypothetical protein
MDIGRWTLVIIISYLFSLRGGYQLVEVITAIFGWYCHSTIIIIIIIIIIIREWNGSS